MGCTNSVVVSHADRSVSMILGRAINRVAEINHPSCSQQCECPCANEYHIAMNELNTASIHIYESLAKNNIIHIGLLCEYVTMLRKISDIPQTPSIIRQAMFLSGSEVRSFIVCMRSLDGCGPADSVIVDLPKFKYRGERRR